MVLFFGLITKEVVEATAAGGVLHPWRRAAAPMVASLGLIAGAAGAVRRGRALARRAAGAPGMAGRLCDRRRVRLFRDPRHLWRASGGGLLPPSRPLCQRTRHPRVRRARLISRLQSRPRARVHDRRHGRGGPAENGEGHTRIALRHRCGRALLVCALFRRPRARVRARSHPAVRAACRAATVASSPRHRQAPTIR